MGRMKLGGGDSSRSSLSSDQDRSESSRSSSYEEDEEEQVYDTYREEGEEEEEEEEDYDFGQHERLKEELERVLSLEGRYGLERCDRLSTPFIGLTNQGATCYLNSLLQALFFCKEFRTQIYNWKRRTGPEGEECIPTQLQKLFARLQFGEQQAASTKQLTKSFGWTGMEAFEQQDVQELCRILFDSLEQNDHGKEFTKPFTGSLVDYIICLRCGHKRAKREEFQDISLFIQGAGHLSKALDNFVQVEKLEGDNQYNCEHCKMKVDAIKGHRLLHLPPVLVLHMKRFVFDWEIERRIKLQEQVEIPMSIDVSSMVGLDSVSPENLGATHTKENNPVDVEDSLTDSLQGELQEGFLQSEDGRYSLSAILIHSGNANSGHYYAIVRTGGNEWHEFNDTHVTKLSPSEVTRMCSPGGMLAEGGAYMMFYSQNNSASTMEGEVSATSASLASSFASHIMPPPNVLRWIQNENELRSKLRKTMRMEKKLVKVKIIRGPMVCPNTSQVIMDAPPCVTLQLHRHKATVTDLKHRAYKDMVPASLRLLFPLSRCRLRRITSENEPFSDSFAESSQSIDEAGIHSSLVVGMEFLLPNQNHFEELNEQDMQLRLFFWDSSSLDFRPVSAAYTFPTHKADLKFDYSFHLTTSLPAIHVPGIKPTVLDLKRSIAQRLGVPEEQVEVLVCSDLIKTRYAGRKPKDASTKTTLQELANNELTLESLGLGSGDGVAVTVSSVKSAKEVESEFTEAQSHLTIHFNDPTLNKKGSPIHYTHSIKLRKDCTLEEARARILQSLALQGVEVGAAEGYHLRKSVKSQQLKDFAASLEDAGLTNESILHVGKGEPIPKGHKMLRVFELIDGLPKLLFRHNVVEGIKVEELREQIAERLGVDSAAKIRILDKTLKNEVGEPLLDGRLLRIALKRFQDGRGVFVQTLDNDESIKNGEFIVKRIFLESQGEKAVIGKLDEVAAQKEWTWGQMQQELCPDSALAYVSPRLLDHPGWVDDISKLDWLEPHKVETSNLADLVISRFPFRMVSGAVIMCAPVQLIGQTIPVCRKSLASALPSTAAKVTSSSTSSTTKAPTRRRSLERRESGGLRISATSSSKGNKENAENGSKESPEGMDDVQGALGLDNNNSSKTLERVPSLDLSTLPPPEERQSYQAEFLANVQDFSESWREATHEMESRGGPTEGVKERPVSSSSSSVKKHKNKKNKPTFQPGDRVLAKAPHWKRFFPGTVFSRDSANNSYAVDFDDGDRLENVDHSHIRSLPSLSRANSHATLPESQASMNQQSQEEANQEPVVVGLGEEDDLCPTDKRARRREKLASRDLRLQLMFMENVSEEQRNADGTNINTDTDTNTSQPNKEPCEDQQDEREEEEEKEKEENEPGPVFPVLPKVQRAKSSPSRSRTRTYIDGEVKQRRVVSSKLSRPRNLEPLPTKSISASLPERMFTSPISSVATKKLDNNHLSRPSRIPRLEGAPKVNLATTLPVGKAPIRSYIPSPSSKASFPHAARKLYTNDSRIEQTLAETPSRAVLQPLPPLAVEQKDSLL